MRYYSKIVSVCFFLILSTYAFSQGVRPLSAVNLYTLFEPVAINGRLLAREAELLDSVKKIEVAKFAPMDTINGWRTWATVKNHAFGKDRGDIVMIADANALHPYFRDKVLQLIAKCKAKGIELAIVESYRTHAKQAEYKGMGKKFTSSGAGRSKHQYGLAVDLVPIVGDSACWHNKLLWKKIGTIGEQLGLRWGGRWKHPYDPGHFEWSGGLTSVQLNAGIEPYIYKKEKLYPCLEEDLKILQKFWDSLEAEQSSFARK